MNFKKWFENQQKDFDFYRDIVLNYLGLDPSKGLSQNLDAFNKENLKQKLQGLGEFSALPDHVQQDILNKIDNTQGGTIGDLIRLMSSHRETI